MADAMASAVAAGHYNTDDTLLDIVASVLERVTL
jgi:hypothetical protein